MNRAKGEVEAAADPSGYSFLMTFFFQGRAVHPESTALSPKSSCCPRSPR